MSKAVKESAASPGPPAPSPAPSADDLLAQQASEDIEKLLEEANVERPSSEQPAAPNAQSPAGGGADDETLRAAARKDSHGDSSESVHPTGDAPSAHHAAAAHEQPVADAHWGKTQSVDSQHEPEDGPESGAHDHVPAATHDTHVADLGDPLPFYLRPLEWINIPIAGISETARQVLGFAAIITLFNAMATIVYVMRFRHHH